MFPKDPPHISVSERSRIIFTGWPYRLPALTLYYLFVNFLLGLELKMPFPSASLKSSCPLTSFSLPLPRFTSRPGSSLAVTSLQAFCDLFPLGVVQKLLVTGHDRGACLLYLWLPSLLSGPHFCLCQLQQHIETDSWFCQLCLSRS